MQSLRCVVCGMMINDKNYDYNKYAFDESNTEELIEFCPFCGAGKEFLHQGDKKLDIEKELDEVTLRILDHAMKLEIFNSEFYKQAAKMAESRDLSERFQQLANVEYVHAKVHQKMGNFKALPELNKMDYDKYKGDKLLIEQALLREKHAVDYYKRYSEEICDETIRHFVDALYDVEKKHIILLSE